MPIIGRKNKIYYLTKSQDGEFVPYQKLKVAIVGYNKKTYCFIKSQEGEVISYQELKIV